MISETCWHATSQKKAQQGIDALWDEGIINKETIEAWGEEHMRTPYRYETNRP